MKSITVFSDNNTDRIKAILSTNFEIKTITKDPFVEEKQTLYLPFGRICIIDEGFLNSSGIKFASILKEKYLKPILVLCAQKAITNEIVKEAVSKANIYRIISLDWPDENILNVMQEAFAYSKAIRKNFFLLREEQEKNLTLTRTQASLQNEEFLNVKSLMYADQIVQYAKASIESYNQILSAIGSGKKSIELLNSIREKINRLVPIDAISLCFRSKRIPSNEKLNISLSFTDQKQDVEPLTKLSEELYERTQKKLNPDSRNKITGFLNQADNTQSICEIVNNFFVKSSLIIPLIHQEKYMGNLLLIRFNNPGFKRRERLIVEHFSEAGNIIARGLRNFEYFEKTKQEWESTFDAISDPVSIVDPDYNLIRVNKAFVRSSKFTIDAVVGEKCYYVFTGRNEPCLNCPLKRSFAERIVRTCDELKVSDKLVYNVWSYPIENTDKEIKSAVLYYRNITQEKFLTQQLMDADKMAEIGILAGSVAHEINNPLGGILAFSQIILRELKASNDQKSQFYEDISEIETAAVRGKKIVESLLNFSRMSTAEDFSLVNIHDVLGTAISLIEYNTKLYNVTITLSYKEDLPPIYGNYNQLLQVFLSIMSNSIGSLIVSDSSKEKKIKILIKHDRDLSNLKLVFTDFGKEFSEDKISKIFNPNILLHESNNIPVESPVKTRAGLSLSVAYGIINDHNGSITFKSNPNEGNTYTLTLPVSKSSEPFASPFKISIQGKN